VRPKQSPTLPAQTFAWEAARATARDLMQGQTDAEVNWLTCFFKVTDESGEILFELPFSECVEVKKLPN
jgi:hypothetical protein